MKIFDWHLGLKLIQLSQLVSASAQGKKEERSVMVTAASFFARIWI